MVDSCNLNPIFGKNHAVWPETRWQKYLWEGKFGHFLTGKLDGMKNITVAEQVQVWKDWKKTLPSTVTHLLRSFHGHSKYKERESSATIAPLNQLPANSHEDIVRVVVKPQPPEGNEFEFRNAFHSNEPRCWRKVSVWTVVRAIVDIWSFNSEYSYVDLRYLLQDTNVRTLKGLFQTGTKIPLSVTRSSIDFSTEITCLEVYQLEFIYWNQSWRKLQENFFDLPASKHKKNLNIDGWDNLRFYGDLLKSEQSI